HLPGTSTYMKFGGFVKTDLFYDLNYAGTYYGAYVRSSFPSSTTPHSGNSTVSMRPTRFTWETRQGTLDNSGNEVKVYFEFDFLSNYDRNSIGLRQFYGRDPGGNVDAADLLGLRGEVGVIAPGAFADLIAVDGDLLADVKTLGAVRL